MCGIVGALNTKMSAKEIRAFFGEADKAGGHSWGVMWLTKDGQVHYDKGVGRLLNHALCRIGELKKAKSWFAHGRFATHGAITARNSHPFHILQPNEVLGMHNGVISNYHKLALEGTQVDSEVIFQRVAEEDWDGLGQLSGWAACVWYDHKANLRTWSSNKTFSFQKRRDGGYVFSSVPGVLSGPGLYTQKDDVIATWDTGEPFVLRRVSLGTGSYYVSSSVGSGREKSWARKWLYDGGTTPHSTKRYSRSSKSITDSSDPNDVYKDAEYWSDEEWATYLSDHGVDPEEVLGVGWANGDRSHSVALITNSKEDDGTEGLDEDEASHMRDIAFGTFEEGRDIKGP